MTLFICELNITHLCGSEHCEVNHRRISNAHVILLKHGAATLQAWLQMQELFHMQSECEEDNSDFAGSEKDWNEEKTCVWVRFETQKCFGGGAQRKHSWHPIARATGGHLKHGEATSST